MNHWLTTFGSRRYALRLTTNRCIRTHCWVESWDLLRPSYILTNFLNLLLIPALNTTIAEWDPRLESNTSGRWKHLERPISTYLSFHLTPSPQYTNAPRTALLSDIKSNSLFSSPLTVLTPVQLKAWLNGLNFSALPPSSRFHPPPPLPARLTT